MDQRQLFVNNILQDVNWSFSATEAIAFAPANIALSKYWGKRDIELNLPVTDSLSISLDKFGATTTVAQSLSNNDVVILNEKLLSITDPAYIRLINFLELFRPNKNYFFKVDTKVNIPIAAGFASSAAGFAALILALARLFGWELSRKELSMLARLGSGSATRSLWDGFVYWHCGQEPTGVDCYAELIPLTWPDLCLGLLMVDSAQKPISSSKAMQNTMNTSPLYNAWPSACAVALANITMAIEEQNIDRLGAIAEQNALAMHAIMQAAQPAIYYALPDTVALMHKVWQFRQEGLPLYFTQDAGPNLKLLFSAKISKQVQTLFPEMLLVQPFVSNT